MISGPIHLGVMHNNALYTHLLDIDISYKISFCGMLHLPLATAATTTTKPTAQKLNLQFYYFSCLAIVCLSKPKGRLRSKRNAHKI